MGTTTPNTVTYSGTIYDDLVIYATALGTGASAPDLTAFGPSGSILALAFDGNATTEQVFGSFELLHWYKEGSDLNFHVHWSPVNANAGNVKWFLEYSVANANGVFGAPTTITVVQAAAGVAWTHQLAGFAAVSGAGLTIGAVVAFRFYRVPTDAADTYGTMRRCCRLVFTS